MRRRGIEVYKDMDATLKLVLAKDLRSVEKAVQLFQILHNQYEINIWEHNLA